MNSAQQADLERALKASAEDARFDKTERKELRAMLDELGDDVEVRAFVRNRAFDIARGSDLANEGQRLLSWLEGVMKAIDRNPGNAPRKAKAEAHFSPGEACRDRIISLLDGAKKTADICVFTVTDNSVSERIAAAHKRGVRVRVITDNDKAYDKGSDAEKLERFGVPLRVDRSEHHMHHKYALFDGDTLLTGSYNWTRSAARYNRENVVVTEDPGLVAAFQRDFDLFWDELE